MAHPARDPMNLNRLAYFAAVVDAGSFTRAGERLGITKAVVSQQVARLEQELGTALLVRTTRKVTPTEAGIALHARCTVILRESAQAFDEVARNVEEPRGTLRLTAPYDFGSAVVVPAVAEFTRTYPACDVDLILSDRLVDVHSVDLAVRVGSLRDSSHLARRIGTMEEYLIAAPDVARRLGRVQGPEDLEGVPFVMNRSFPELDVLRLTHPTLGRRTVHVRRRVTVDATPAAHAAVLAGAGLSVVPDYLAAGDVAAGRLVRVLPAWRLRNGGIYLLLPSARFRPAKVTRFIEVASRAARRLARQDHPET